MKHGKSGFVGAHGGSGFVAQLLAAGSTLLDGLVSYWTLDETSGVRYDSVGENDLTDNNTVGAVLRGPEGTVASFVAANSESLSKASFVAPDDYAISLWMKPTAAAIAAGTTHFFDCGAAWPTNVQFALAMAGAAIRVTISDGSGYVQKDGLGTLVAGEWTHLIVVYDSATKKASIYMDNDSGAVSDALAGSADRTSATLYVGKFVDGGGSYVYDGILDEVAIWSRVLTEDERASLFNRGNGKTYEDLTAAEKTGLVSYWKLDETSGVRYDSHGSNDLTDNNTVLSAPASAVKFTASNQELRITPYGDVDLSATGFTVAGWFYTANGFPTVSYDDGSANRVFLWIGANFYVLDSAGGFQGVTVDPPYPRWSHVILSYDPADKKGYAWINGALKGSTPVLTNGLAYKPNAPFYFGHGGTDGGASEVGFWNRLLTSDERAALAATVHTYDDLSAALKTGLMSWWPLGGGGADVHGGKNLNPSNGPTFQLAAMDGGAASFVAANSETLTKATAVIDTSADWTAAMWVRLDVAGYGRPITAVTSPHLHAGLLYESQYSGSFNRLYNNYNYGVDPIDLGNNLGEWVLLFLEYNKATTTMRHCGYGTASNNGVWSTGTVAELPAMPDFRLGQETTGLIDEVALWSRVLTDDERAELYAAGAGKFYPFEG